MLKRKKVLLFFLSVLLYQLNISAQIITTVAGGTSIGLGDNGPATNASMGTTADIVFDKVGNMYVSAGNNRIRKVDYSNIIRTIAGNGTNGFGGDDGPATSALFKNPTGIAFDSTGNLFVADHFNYRIRKVSTSGIITTIAGNGILGFSGDGTPATSAMIGPNWLAIDKHGDIYFNGHHVVAKITAGLIYVIAGKVDIPGYSGDGGPATSAMLNGNEGIAIDLQDNIYIADYYNNRIRKINAVTQVITTIAGTGVYGYSGDGGPATAAELRSPFDIVVDADENVYFSDYNNNVIRKISSAGIITTIAGSGIQGFSGDGALATNAKLYGPYGIALDSCNNLYIADGHNNRIRKIAFNPNCWALNVQETIRQNIVVYPNPTIDQLHMDGAKKNESYKIYDIIGSVVLQGELHEGNNTIPISSLFMGIYMVEVSNPDGKRTVTRIVKQ